MLVYSTCFLWTIAPLTFSLVSSPAPPPLPLFPVWISTCIQYTRILYSVGRGVWGHRRGGGLGKIKHLPQSTFTGKLFRYRHLASLSIFLIFLGWWTLAGITFQLFCFVCFETIICIGSVHDASQRGQSCGFMQVRVLLSTVKATVPGNFITSHFLTGGFFVFFMYCIQHCLICRPSDFTVSEDAGIEPRTVATSALAVRLSNHYARSHPHFL